MAPRGELSAFVVARFAEMHSFPLTIYLVAAAVGRLPAGQPFSHESGTLSAGLYLGTERVGSSCWLEGRLWAAGSC